MENFKNILEKEITTYTRRTQKSKRISYSLKIGILFLTLSLTIVLGLSFKDDSYTQLTRNIALVLGAIVTFLSGLMSFWNIEEYFLTNKAIETKLKSLLVKYRIYTESENIDIKIIESIKNEFLVILNKRGDFFEN